MKRFLKREIKLIPTEELNTRFCRILERAEILDAEDIPVADAREILWIADVLRERLYKLLPGLPRLEVKEPEEEPGEDCFNQTMETYTKRKTKKK